jgi:hypothetical protein
MSQIKQKTPLLKPKFGSQLGFRGPGNLKGSVAGGKPGSPVVKFDPSRFKTQHKG